MSLRPKLIKIGKFVGVIALICFASWMWDTNENRYDKKMDDLYAEQIYIASINSEAFHKGSCRSVSMIKDENLIGFETKDEAIQAGKRPCKVCKP